MVNLGRGLHGSHGLVLERDEGHAQRFGVDLFLLLPVLLFQLGLHLGVVADRLLLQDKQTRPHSGGVTPHGSADHTLAFR